MCTWSIEVFNSGVVILICTPLEATGYLDAVARPTERKETADYEWDLEPAGGIRVT